MATADEIKIRIIAKDEASKVFRQTQGASEKLKSSITALKASFIGLSVAGGAFLKSVIQTGSETEQLKIRMRFLTGSVKQGAQAFQALTRYASRVPFELEEIQRASTALLTIAEDTDELNQLLELTGDLVVVSGLSFEDTARQIQRSFAAGISAADLFRDSGVKAMLGFEEGVSYSAEKTKQIILSAWQDSSRGIQGAAQELAKTFAGQMSMMNDAWRKLKDELAEAGVLEEATKIVIAMTEGIKDPAFQNGVKSFTTNLIDLFKFIVENKDALMVVGAAWLGGKVAGAKGAIAAGTGMALKDTKTGDLIGRMVKSLRELFDTRELSQRSMEELSKSHSQLFNDLLNETDPKKAAQLRRNLLEIEAAMDVVRERSTKELPTERPWLKDPLLNPVDGAGAVKEKTEAVTDYYASIAKGIDNYADSSKDLGKATAAAAEKGMKSLEDAMVDMAMGAKSAKDAFKDMARSIVADIMRIYIRKQLLGQVSAMGGGSGIAGSLAGFFDPAQWSTAYTYGTNIGSQQTAMLAAQNAGFAGGGFTGYGGRSGGVDGKGGFPAILHPNETVIDHAQGQQMGGDMVNVNFNINAIDTQTGTQFLAANKPMIIGMIAQAMNRKGNRSTV